MSDNGPQFSSREFRKFATNYDFSHVTSSPHYPQSNGQVERSVRTVKKLLQDEDPNRALLIYRTTPFAWCDLSPAELLMGRKLRSNLPLTIENLTPNWDYIPEFRKRDQEFKNKQKSDFDKHHRVQPLAPIPDNTQVWVETGENQTPGHIISQDPSPRSYIVETQSGATLRRNRRHIIPSPVGDSNETDNNQMSNDVNSGNRVTTRSGTGYTAPPPDRYTPSW